MEIYSHAIYGLHKSIEYGSKIVQYLSISNPIPEKKKNGPALYAAARVSRVIVNALSNIIKHRTMSSRVKWAGHTETSKSDRKT